MEIPNELIRKSKSNNDRQYNGQKHENTTYGQHYTTHRKLKIEEPWEGDELMWFGRVGCFCSISGTRRATVVKNQVINKR